MNEGGMDTLNWFIKKLYRSLKTPTSRLDSETGFNDGTEMLREELKFAKMIIRQQQRFAAGIKRAFITHLKFKEMFDEDDYDLYEENIFVQFNAPTNFFEMRESQRLNLRMEIFNNVTGNENVSSIWAMKKYLEWKDEDILANVGFLKKEAGIQFEVDQIRNNGPNWKEMLEQQAEMGEDGGMGGDLGGGGGLGGGDSGLGGVEDGIPEFGGGDVGGDEAPDEAPPEEPEF
jgi:hypothetical protein